MTGKGPLRELYTQRMRVLRLRHVRPTLILCLIHSVVHYCVSVQAKMTGFLFIVLTCKIGEYPTVRLRLYKKQTICVRVLMMRKSMPSLLPDLDQVQTHNQGVCR